MKKNCRELSFTVFAVQVEVKCISHAAQPPERVADFRYSRGDESLSPPVGDKVVLQNHWTGEKNIILPSADRKNPSLICSDSK